MSQVGEDHLTLIFNGIAFHDHPSLLYNPTFKDQFFEKYPTATEEDRVGLLEEFRAQVHKDQWIRNLRTMKQLVRRIADKTGLETSDVSDTGDSFSFTVWIDNDHVVEFSYRDAILKAEEKVAEEVIKSLSCKSRFCMKEEVDWMCFILLNEAEAWTRNGKKVVRLERPKERFGEADNRYAEQMGW